MPLIKANAFKEAASKLAKTLADKFDLSEIIDSLEKGAKKKPQETAPTAPRKPRAVKNTDQKSAELNLKIMKAPPEKKEALIAKKKALRKPKNAPSLNEMVESVGKPEVVYGRRQYKNNPSRVLGKEHMAEGWEAHNEHLVNGLKPDTGLDDGIQNETLTPGVRIAEHSDGRKVLVKPQLSEKEYHDLSGGFVPDEHFFDKDFTSAHREAAYQKLADQFFGLGDHVPATAVFKHPNGEYHSAHEFIPNTQAFYRAVPINPGNNKDTKETISRMFGDHPIEKLAIMNNVLGNNDRHFGNALVDKNNKLYMIDHGLAFDYGGLGGNREPSYALAHMNTREPVQEDTHKWLDTLDEKKLANHMATMKIEPKLIASAVNRLREIKDWSKRERTAKALGEQEHHGLLDDALHLGWMHTLEDNELRPKEDIDRIRQRLVSKTK